MRHFQVQQLARCQCPEITTVRLQGSLALGMVVRLTLSCLSFSVVCSHICITSMPGLGQFHVLVQQIYSAGRAAFPFEVFGTRNAGHRFTSRLSLQSKAIVQRGGAEKTLGAFQDKSIWVKNLYLPDIDKARLYL